MTFCKYCGKGVHDTALACPNCGGVQQQKATSGNGHFWMSITSMVLGIMALLTLLDNSPWDKDTIVGVMVVFVIPSIAFGSISISKQKEGKGMAIGGIILASMALIMLLGISINISN